MSKVKIDLNAFVYPMPMVLAGAMVKDRANFLAVAWVSRLNYKPPMIGIALGKSHYTNQGIHAHKAFSVNIPGRALLEKTDYCGLVSGREADKSTLFSTSQGELTGAPMIEGCPVCMECRLVQVVDLPTNEVFVGEIVAAYAEENCLTQGKPDIKKIEPFTLTMPDNNYWEVGGHAGRAWEAGKRVMQAR